MASTLLNEQGVHPDLIELQLAHSEHNTVRAAYNRAQRLSERRAMMHHFESFINGQIASGRYGSVSEVIRASLRLLEEREQKIGALRQALIDGENSGDVGELDIRAIKRKARRRTK